MKGDGAGGRRADLGRQAVEIMLFGFESVLYVIAFVMLMAAAVLVVVDGVHGVIESIGEHGDAPGAGVLVLDRVLLVVIIAELSYTLRTVIRDREIVAEPFLLIGLIAIIRRVLILTAALEQSPPGEPLSQLLFELGGLSLMVLAIGVTLLILRFSAGHSVLPHLRMRASSQVHPGRHEGKDE